MPNEVQYLTQIHLKLQTYHGKSCKTLDCGLFGIALNVGFQLIMIYPNKVQYQAKTHLNYKHLAGAQ